MAESNEENEKTKRNTKTTEKKIATGSTKKVVQKRSSSVAGKSSKKVQESSKTKSVNNKKNTSTTAKQSKEIDETKKTKTKATKNVSSSEEKSKKSANVKPKKEVKKEPKEGSKEKKAKKNTIKINEENKSEEVTNKKEIHNEELKQEEKKAQVEEVKQAEKSKKQKETKLKKKEPAEMEETVAKEIKNRKKISNAEFGKINGRVFQNICIAVAIMFYLDFIILGFVNIEHEVFVTDLKVFSIALLAISIGIFEYGYKKDSGRHAIHGVEILILAFITMALIYVNLMWADKFIYVVAFITYLIAMYYVAKSIIVYHKMKKEYFLNEMKEIIKK